MNTRLLPLAPPQRSLTSRLPRLPVPALPSIPWIELTLFGVMIWSLATTGG